MEIPFTQAELEKLKTCANWRKVSVPQLIRGYVNDWLSVDTIEANGQLTRRAMYRDQELFFDLPASEESAIGTSTVHGRTQRETTEKQAFFCVESGTDPEAEGEEDPHYFVLYSEALSFAEEKNRRFPAVWMAEKGEYENQNGRIMQGWVYFWWSPEVTRTWGPTEGRKRGYPDPVGPRSYIRDYRPLATD